jgi:hypothetical protein
MTLAQSASARSQHAPGHYPTRWKKGQSGNPKGRQAGTRNKLQESFFEKLYKAWLTYGDAALMAAAMTTPTDFVRIVAMLMPRDVEVAVTNIKVERMSSSELRAILARYHHQDHGNALEANRNQDGVFQVGAAVRSDTGKASSPADGEADQGKPR